jgi:hypothetical protein
MKNESIPENIIIKSNKYVCSFDKLYFSAICIHKYFDEKLIFLLSQKYPLTKLSEIFKVKIEKINYRKIQANFSVIVSFIIFMNANIR